MLVNWNALLPYKTKKDRSFEQLCYQIAAKEYTGQGKLTSIDDSGGGDGVEFYLTLPSGEQMGWQAKYYEGSPVRLNASRKKKIEASLVKSLDQHSLMSTWFLCLPMVLTVGENDWVETELVKQIPASRTVAIVVWDEDVLHEFMNRPAFSGLKQAFFNSLELSSTWFQQKFDQLSLIVEQKFELDLYTKNSYFFHWYVDPVLLTPEFRDNRIAVFPLALKKSFDEGNLALKQLRHVSDWVRPLCSYMLVEYEKLNSIYQQIESLLHERLDQLKPNRIFELSDGDFQESIENFDSILHDIEVFKQKWYLENIFEKGEKIEGDYKSYYRNFVPIETSYKDLLQNLKYYISESSMPIRWRSAHYWGDAGDGKTNFCLALAKTYIESGWPVIFIPAIKLTSDLPISSQLLDLLDIRSDFNFSDFLSALDALGKIHNIRIPFILDGLNEAIDHQGQLNRRLELDMPALEKQILGYQNLALVTTCRPAYQKAIWGEFDFQDKRFHALDGFVDTEDKKQMIRRYFSVYKIQTDLSFISLDKFTKPLYLKIFCEGVNPRREVLVSITLGYDSIYTIFDRYIAQVDANVFQRLTTYGKHAPLVKYRTAASATLLKLGHHLWGNPVRGISLEQLMLLTDGKDVEDYSRSVAKALFDEELLLKRDWHRSGELVYVTYDLLAGYFIAQYLIGQGIADIGGFIANHDDARLFHRDQRLRHPLHEDILSALISLLPIRKGIFVHDLISRPTKGNNTSTMLFARSIGVMMLLSPAFIPTSQVELVSGLSVKPKNLPPLLHSSREVWFVCEHPFNFSYWEKIIFALPMNLRDVYWSEYLREMERTYLDDTIIEFTSLQLLASHNDQQQEKIKLVAKFLMWNFTSTVSSVISQSVQALFEYASRYPDAFYRHYKYAATINDPSVFLQMSIVLYNATTGIAKSQRMDCDDWLAELYNFISQNVLSPKGIFATNHLDTRDYNYAILKLIERRFTRLVPNPQSEKLKSTFDKLGITNWRKVKDRDDGHYRDGNALTDYYFNKHKMPMVMVGPGNEYNNTPEFNDTKAKMRWRAYKLGYSLSKFGELDKSIARFRAIGQEQQRVYRYADKYIGIAHQEYCGFLDGRGEFSNYKDDGYLRTFEIKNDPEIDIGNVPTRQFLQRQFIDLTAPLAEWCSDESIPQINEYLIYKNVADGRHFVLLDGDITQTDESSGRKFFVIMDSVFVKICDLEQARKAFFDAKSFRRGIEYKPSSHHAHQSEIPDSDLIPQNSFTTRTYSLEEELVDIRYSTINLIKDGKKISDEHANQLWEQVLNAQQYLFTPKTEMAGMNFPMIKFTSGKDEKDYQEVFVDMGISLEEEEYTKKEYRDIDLELEVFIPVRAINNEYYLCKNIIDWASLYAKSGSTDLYSPIGELAAFSHNGKIGYDEGERFTYLDKNILNNYLKEKGLVMFWLIWGDRDYLPKDDHYGPTTASMADRDWASFKQAIEYEG